MANWIEGYYDELYWEEQTEKVGVGLAAGIRDALERPGAARTVIPTVPLNAVSGSIPLKTVKVYPDAMNAVFASALLGDDDG